MYARIGALVCLLTVGALAAPANEDSHGSGKVLVYLNARADSSPPILAAMQQETGALMQSAGLHVRWSNPPERPEIVDGSLVVVELTGVCDSDPELWARAELSSLKLAFTPLEKGGVLPFSTVDCNALGTFLAPALSRQPQARRNYLYGRALGRILAHELYHIIAHTSEHSRQGVAEAAVTVHDLIGDDLVFGDDSVARLQTAAESEGR